MDKDWEVEEGLGIHKWVWGVLESYRIDGTGVSRAFDIASLCGDSETSGESYSFRRPVELD